MTCRPFHLGSIQAVINGNVRDPVLQKHFPIKPIQFREHFYKYFLRQILPRRLASASCADVSDHFRIQGLHQQARGILILLAHSARNLRSPDPNRS